MASEEGGDEQQDRPSQSIRKDPSIFCFLNGPFPASFYLFLSFQYTVDSKQMSNNFLPMTGFEPRTSGIGNERSTN